MPYKDRSRQLECQRRGYTQHREKRVAEVYARKQAYKKAVREYVFEYLATHPCVDCGEADLVVLDFDHRDGGNKRQAVSEMMAQGFSVRIVAAEIAKCDVRCANCHRRRTATQFGNWRALALSEWRT